MPLYWHDMKTYNQLTPDQQQAAFNYHLNSLIPAMTLLADCPKETPWQSLTEQVTAQTPTAQTQAEAAIYDYDEEAGIMMPVIPMATTRFEAMLPVGCITNDGKLVVCV